MLANLPMKRFQESSIELEVKKKLDVLFRDLVAIGRYVVAPSPTTLCISDGVETNHLTQYKSVVLEVRCKT